MNAISDQSQTALLPALEARARQAATLAELHFSMANDSYALLPFQQTLVFCAEGGSARLRCVSGLAKLSEDSPYLVWLKRIWPELQQHFNEQPAWLMAQDVPQASADLLEGWSEWWPMGVYAVPLKRRDGCAIGLGVLPDGASAC
jgi:hypothetical protein